MNYAKISEETIALLYKSYESLKKSPLDPLIRVLVELRVSQINGCAYCCNLHSNEARQLNISTEKLDSLVAWVNSQAFTDKEKLALQWCEEVTCLKGELKKTKESLKGYFSEREIVDLTVSISLMNAFNRMAISLKD